MAVYSDTPKPQPIPAATPYQKGYAAGRARSSERCPYARGTQEHADWYSGYGTGYGYR